MKKAKTVAQRQKAYLKDPVKRAKHWLRVELCDMLKPEQRRARQRAYYARHKVEILGKLRARYAVQVEHDKAARKIAKQKSDNP